MPTIYLNEDDKKKLYSALYIAKESEIALLMAYGLESNITREEVESIKDSDTRGMAEGVLENIECWAKLRKKLKKRE